MHHHVWLVTSSSHKGYQLYFNDPSGTAHAEAELLRVGFQNRDFEET